MFPPIQKTKRFKIILVTCGILVLWSISLDIHNTSKVPTTVCRFPNHEKSIRGEHRKFSFIASPITIAAVVCGNDTINSYYDKTAVMIKSVVLSAKTYGILKINFHIFLEHKYMDKFFEAKFQEFGVLKNNIFNFTAHFHAAVEAVPKEYRDDMIYHHRYRCDYVRSYLPVIYHESKFQLSISIGDKFKKADVDSVLYMDSDTIVTGDIRRLWILLETMSNQQMIAMGRNNEPEDTHYSQLERNLFHHIPYFPPKGLNSGVILMNLTRLREFGWEEKFTRAYQDYSKITHLSVQRTLNILLFYNPGLVQVIPCELHFMHVHCTKGLICSRLTLQNHSIHLVHGTDGRFEEGREFYNVFIQYKLFNMTRDDLFQDLILPIHKRLKESTKVNSECDGIFNQHLFKNYTE